MYSHGIDILYVYRVCVCVCAWKTIETESMVAIDCYRTFFGWRSATIGFAANVAGDASSNFLRVTW